MLFSSRGMHVKRDSFEENDNGIIKRRNMFKTYPFHYKSSFMVKEATKIRTTYVLIPVIVY